MAIIRTRYRKQTTLTYLAESLATVNAELASFELQAADAFGEQVAQLKAQQSALMETIRQFDPELDPGAVGALVPVPSRKRCSSE